MASAVAELKELAQAEERTAILKRHTHDSATTEEEYDKIAPFYHQVFQHHAVDIVPFVSFADLHPGHKVLDLGCGAGWVTVQAASRVGLEGQITAIDASGHCLRQASIAARLSGLQNVRLLKGDIRNLDKFCWKKDPGFKGFDRILLLWVMQLVSPADQEQFLCHLATHLSPGGLIVFSQDHEHHELACIDALPFDGSDTDELHWLIGDARGFKQTRQYAENQIKRAGLIRVKVEDCYRDDRYGYEDHAPDIRRNADIAWRRDGGVSKECSRLYLEYFKREKVTNIMEERKKRNQNVAIKNVSVLIAAKCPNPQKGVSN